MQLVPLLVPAARCVVRTPPPQAIIACGGAPVGVPGPPTLSMMAAACSSLGAASGMAAWSYTEATGRLSPEVSTRPQGAR